MKNVKILCTGGDMRYANAQPWNGESASDYLARLDCTIYMAEVGGKTTMFSVWKPDVAKAWFSRPDNQQWFFHHAQYYSGSIINS